MPRLRSRFPRTGMSDQDLDAALAGFSGDAADWRSGRVPLYVFDGGEEVTEVGRRAYMAFFSENALGGKRAFHGLKRMEDEVLDYGLDLFHAPDGGAGTMTTGGSESIFLAVKAARDAFRAAGRPRHGLNMVVPYSAHPAFDKAGDVMDIEVRRSPLGPDFRADVAALAARIDARTMMIVGSAPCFPHGVVDPITGLSERAEALGVWLHVDACVGGYIAPFFKRIGRDIPVFDFALAGVRSLSADLHKFGFTPKPASTLFYRDRIDLERANFDFEGWPHGRFATATLTGTRAGGAIAGAWAVLNYLGLEGYECLARRLAGMTDAYVAGIEEIDGLHLWTRPDLSIINFGARDLDIFVVAEHMQDRGWVPGLTRDPKGLHMMMSLFHEAAMTAYLSDLRSAVTDSSSMERSTPTIKSAY